MIHDSLFVKKPTQMLFNIIRYWYLVDCICLWVSGSSNIFTMGSVSDWSCFNWATTVVLFSLRATEKNYYIHATNTFSFRLVTNDNGSQYASLDLNMLLTNNWRKTLLFVCKCEGNTYNVECLYQHRGSCIRP